MHVIISLVRWQLAPVYMDDISAFMKTQTDHIEQIWLKLRLLYEIGATLKLENIKFFAEKVDYSGYFSRPGRLHFAEKTMDCRKVGTAQDTDGALLLFLPG